MLEPLASVAMGCDEERHICTGGDLQALSRAKSAIVRRCRLRGTGELPSFDNRWQFVRYFLEEGGCFYFDYDEIYESQTPEVAI